MWKLCKYFNGLQLFDYSRQLCTTVRNYAESKNQPKIDDMYEDLKEKTILVTGGAAGIGNALVKRLVEIKAEVIAVDCDVDALKVLRTECPSVHILKLDLGNWQETKNILKNLSLPRGLHGLVNNAGISYLRSFNEMLESDIDKTFSVNFKGVFNVTQCVLPFMYEGASIVMISAATSQKAAHGHSVFSASKAAIDGLTRNLALELGPHDIRVNSINSSIVLTERGRVVWSSSRSTDHLIKQIPLARLCEVDEIVDAICFFLSDRSSFMTGHHLLLEGGLNA